MRGRRERNGSKFSGESIVSVNVLQDLEVDEASKIEDFGLLLPHPSQIKQAR